MNSRWYTHDPKDNNGQLRLSQLEQTIQLDVSRLPDRFPAALGGSTSEAPYVRRRAESPASLDREVSLQLEVLTVELQRNRALNTVRDLRIEVSRLHRERTGSLIFFVGGLIAILTAIATRWPGL
jgi:hypothetical protein